MHIINPVHSTSVPLPDSTPLMIPTSVDCQSPTGCVRNASTSGATSQATVTLEQVQLTVLALLAVVEMLQKFVGHDFFCESGSPTTPTKQWYTSNPLWNRKGCYSGSKCCSPSRGPWFFKALPVEATSDIEVRWCQPAGGAASDRTGIEQLEIYVF